MCNRIWYRNSTLTPLPSEWGRQQGGYRLQRRSTRGFEAFRFRGREQRIRLKLQWCKVYIEVSDCFLGKELGRVKEGVKRGKKGKRWILRTNLTVERCGVNSFGENLNDELLGVLECHAIGVVTLEDGFSGLLSSADREGLPAAIVAAWVRCVKLESEMLVPPRVDEGDAEGTLTTILGVALLQIAHRPHQVLHGTRFLIRIEVLLRTRASIVDENVGIGSDTGYSAHHVLVQAVHLLAAFSSVQTKS